MTRTRRFVAALAVAAASAVVTPAVALAQQYPGGRTTDTVPPAGQVLSTQQTPTEVLGVQQTRAAAAGGLAVTGSDVVGLTGLGVVLVGGGFLLVRRSRKLQPLTVS